MLILFTNLALATQPNILFIVADDLGYNDTTVYSSSGITTPHLEALAAQGVTIQQGYVPSATCSPSRAGTITGKYQQRFGFEFNMGRAEDAHTLRRGLPIQELTIADYMKAEGYTTGLIGKWHLGSQEEFYPTNRGFDYFWGIVAGSTSYQDPTHPSVHNATLQGHTLYDLQDTGFIPIQYPPSYPQPRTNPSDYIYTGPWPGTIIHNDDKYLTTEISRQVVKAIQVIEEPWFLMINYNAPHTPFQAPTRLVPNDARPEHQRVYEGMVLSLDESIGRITSELETLGLSDNTIVTFTSDNGCAAYTDVCDCSPTRGGKACHLEGGIRIPFIISWPGANLVSNYDYPVSSLDLLPTFISIAGGAPPIDADGTDLTPYITGADETAPHEYLFWKTGEQKTIRHENWKLRITDLDVQLHDIATDPEELVNVVNNNPSVVSTLETVFLNWEATLAVPLWDSRTDYYTYQCGELIPFNP